MNLEKDSAVLEVDLPEIYAFIAKADVAAAERVLDAVEETILGLVRHPFSGVLSPVKPTVIADLRMIPVNRYPKYLIFYTVMPESVRILYVVHSARDLPQLFGEDRRE